MTTPNTPDPQCKPNADLLNIGGGYVNKMTNTPDRRIDESMASMCAEHYWASENIPNCPLWARRCMLCGQYDSKDMNEQLKSLVETMMMEVVATIDPLNQTASQKQMVREQRQRIPQVLDKYFKGGK